MDKKVVATIISAKRVCAQVTGHIKWIGAEFISSCSYVVYHEKDISSNTDRVFEIYNIHEGEIIPSDLWCIGRFSDDKDIMHFVYVKEAR